MENHHDHHGGKDHAGHQPPSPVPGQATAVASPPVDHAGHAHEQHGAHDDDHAVHSHGQHAGHSTAMFKNRFWLTLVLSVPVVYFSPMVGHLLGYEPLKFPGSTWIPAVLGTVIFLYGGQPFLKGGLQELKTRSPGMMLLIAMAITVAFAASWVTSLGIGGFDLDFWWELALLVAIMLLGHWIEMRALGSAQGALDALAALLPDEADRITGSGTETVPVSELREGDIVLVRMRTIDVVLFDKTGTLTTGEPDLKDIAAVAGGDTDRLLALAAAVESDSEHPVARAIVRAARHRNLTIQDATGFSSLIGRGVRATVDGRTVHVGGPALLRELGAVEPEPLARSTRTWMDRGAAVLHVIDGNSVLGAVSLEDAVRPESRQAVAALQNRGIKVAMITGDARQVALAVAEELHIDEVFAEVLPADKDKKVAELQGRGLKVAMVGDGVNDSPALARAEVGIAIGAGTDVAMESAGVVLAGNDPRAVLSMVDLSRASYRKMWQNLIWATGYNVLSVPLAAGVLAFAGVVLSPAAGAVLMSVSTIVVALNAQLLRRVKLNPAQVR
ncbi:HAD-IC family P-type ATPase [Pseudarthrobacter sp. MDT1-22]